MLEQATGLALLAAVSPTALLATAVYLGSARPRLIVLCYLAGAVLTTAVVGGAALLLLRSGHFELPSHRAPRYGLRLGLGLLTLGAALVAATRKPRSSSEPGQQKGLVSRLVASPAPATAFATGVLLFLPSLTFIAAVQVIATARAGAAVTALGMALVVIIDAMFIWLPFLAFLAAPEVTTRRLAAFNRWLRRHGRTLLTAALAVAGVLVTANGLAGLLR